MASGMGRKLGSVFAFVIFLAESSLALHLGRSAARAYYKGARAKAAGNLGRERASLHSYESNWPILPPPESQKPTLKLALPQKR